MKARSEWDLIKRCRKGSAAAFEPIVREYEREALAIAETLLLDADDAEDAAQDAFIRAYKALGTLEEGSEFGPWFRTILRNICRDRLRSPALSRRVSLSDEDHPAPLAVDAGIEAAVERAELAGAVREALGRLSPEHRDVLVLKEMEGMNYDEMAAELRVPKGTIASRLFKARAALRRILSDVRLAPGGVAP